MDTDSSYLQGQLLIAMPQMSDPRFARTVIYMCAHSADGAMGLVINKPIGSLTFAELMDQMGIELGEIDDQIRVHFGGPVESSRGFVLHTTDYVQESTLVVNEEFALTATVDVLKSIADGSGPSKSILALGYAGWSPGQLDGEIQANGWLNVAADPELVFASANDDKWERALAKVGIDLSALSSLTGHA
ncbi:MAG: YqgE/AlgH family protein [Rhodospirillaceae bacterium]|nr:YqgE/AlgH family protein [Rhodospirillaceae bacterium]|tara:strand:- start:1275 stop:1841 length:567 start_codon:yes stop_codon:yes gene_type:complete